jgi:hypothetical protein
MKKKLFLVAMAACVLALGLVLIGCKSDSDDEGGGDDTGGDIVWAGTWKQIKDANDAALGSADSHTINLVKDAGYSVTGPQVGRIPQAGKNGTSWDPNATLGSDTALKLENSVYALYLTYEKISATQIKITGSNALINELKGIYEKQSSTGGGDGGGYSGTGVTPTEFVVASSGIVYGISIRTDAAIDSNIGTGMKDDQTKQGFIVKVNGNPEDINKVYSYSTEPKVYVQFGDGESLTGTETVTLSYDGTGAYADKLKIFTDKLVSWREK